MENIDKIEVIEPFKIVQVRMLTTSNGESGYHRYSLTPLDDISEQPRKVQDVCSAHWTDSIKESYQNWINRTIED